MIAKTISHYRIVEEIGRGGMGVVYKAEDLKLKRTVAIKFLPVTLAADTAERERFLLEAQAASALNHPNVATIYEIDESDGASFIVMEYVEGRTLRAARSGLSVAQVVDIGIQVAEALALAHEKGIVHRDIKSDNIMLRSDGRVAVMDFGLAKVQGLSRLTKAGSTIGTTAYMSPEQVQGLETDARTDIFSLGCVLYELLTGELPFRGGHDAAVMYEIVNVNPPPLRTHNASVEPELERIVMNCLEKDRDERYQSAREVAVDLKRLRRDTEGRKIPRASARVTAGDAALAGRTRWLRALILGIAALCCVAAAVWFFVLRHPSATPASENKRMAVIPFRSLKADPETAFLGFSLADQIITRLSYVKSVVVRPSDAVRKFEHTDAALTDIAHQLDVGIILTGSYIKQNDRFRLNAQLVNVDRNEVIWSEGVEMKYADLFGIQDSIARKIIDGLQLHLSAEEGGRLGRDVPADPVAYEYYLRAMADLPATGAAWKVRIQLLEKSVQLDSSFAPAWASLGYAYRQAVLEMGVEEQYYDLAEQALRRAMSLNKENPIAIYATSIFYAESGRVEEAADLLNRAMRISPNLPPVHSALGYTYRYAGFLDESIREYTISQTLSGEATAWWGCQNQITKALIYEGKYDEAVRSQESVFDSLKVHHAQSELQFLFYRGIAHYYAGNRVRAIQIFDTLSSIEEENTWSLFGNAYTAAAQGNKERVRELARQFEGRRILDAEMAYRLVHFYSMIGENTDALRALRRSVDGGFFNYPYISADPLTESVRSTPEFKAILERVKERHEAFRARFGKQG